MFELLINKQIGDSFWDEGITPEFVRDQLKSVPEGEDVCIVIDSPGGSIWDCISIYNEIRQFARAHDGTIETYIQGTAASAASIIALAAKDVSRKNKVVVEDNSVFMIHNSWVLVSGDRNQLRESADNMERIDNLMAQCYSRVSGRALSVIKKEMDETTYFYGDEIVNAGFADNVMATEETEETKEEFIEAARAKLLRMHSKARAVSGEAALQKLAALAVNVPMGKAGSKPGNNMPSGKVEGCMTVDELKKSNPDVYESVFAMGKADGVKVERERAGSLLKMGELAGCMDVSAEFIRNGSEVADNAVQEKFFEKRLAKKTLDAQALDKVPDVVTPKGDGMEDKASNERDFMSAFSKETGLAE